MDTSQFRNPDADPRGPWAAYDLSAPFLRPIQIFEFLGSLPPEGRSWRFSRARLNKLASDGAILERPGRRPLLKRYLADIQPDPLEVHQPPRDIPAFPELVREFSTALARRLALSPTDLASLEWRDLERALAAALEGIGFETCLTRPAKDGGFDIELRADGETYLVEVKHWTAPSRVGPEPISEFAEVLVTKCAEGGLLLSSSGFTKRVFAQRLEVAPTRIALGDGRKIIGLCQHYVDAGRGIWSPRSALPDVLFLDTL